MRGHWISLLLLSTGCATAGSSWISEPFSGDDAEEWSEVYSRPMNAAPPNTSRRPPPRQQPSARTLSELPPLERPAVQANAKLEGKVLGKFRNTYYDFPSETDYSGNEVPLMNATCRPIKSVPKEFHDRVCVQGSGMLASGSTVSFNRRDCECASVCPRTNQRICFDELDKQRFPWGRGATGGAITPLLTVAVDSDVIPLGTAVYIPEYDGLARDAAQSSYHDGCFIAQDRGLKVKGKHIDVFTGHESVTKLWNRLVPSNEGVTVVLESPRCARAPTP